MKKKTMNPKTTMSISDARKNIFNIAEEVQKPNNYYTFTENGRPKAVLMSAEDFDSWKETMEVMREFPDLDKDIRDARRDFKNGNYKTWTTLEQLLAKEGFSFADKSSKKYGISNKRQTKRGKGVKKDS